MADPIYVTKSFLPPIEEFNAKVAQIWSSGQLTNQGPMVSELENDLQALLDVNNFHFVSNGTIALQLAIRALDLGGSEIITTPFSYVATTSSILWEYCTPVFVDIEPNSLCIDASKIESAITAKTKAILPVHVFGNPCDVDAIDEIAKNHGLKVIYDAAHAFGVKYKGRELATYGDISVYSFHATKLFQTIEGGGLVVSDKELSKKIDLMKRFGHEGDVHVGLGINAKASEFQAAMGLCNLKYIDSIIEDRKRVSLRYDNMLDTDIEKPEDRSTTEKSYAYYPILLKSERQLVAVVDALKAKNIFARRYFYPSLNKLPYIDGASDCVISEDVSSRIICLPLYVGLEDNTIDEISEVVNAEIKQVK